MAQASRAETVEHFDPVWARIQEEAEAALRDAPVLATFFYSALLNHETLERAIAQRVAARIGHEDLPSDLVEQMLVDCLDRSPELGQIFRADIAAVVDRDPACKRWMEPLLYFKGFLGLQTSRFAHVLWEHDQRDLALYLQSRASAVFSVDIHPGARIGRGIMLDHATGIVVGETAVIEDEVSMLHDVTLGGNGKERGDRHPKVRRGVLIGAGAKILGNIEIGPCARVAAGSVVLSDVPCGKTVAGVPARVVGEAGCSQPARTMDHLLRETPPPGAS
jgi:serine O-acetyltransferase